MNFNAPSSQTLFSIAVALLTFGVYYRHNARRKLPPGPRGLPFIGNLLQFAQPEVWRQCTKWGREFGPITSITLAGRHRLVISSHKVASDLLDHKAAIYSDRPRMIVASEILTRNLTLTLTRYGDLWRTMRRAVHEALYRGSSSKFYSIHEKEATLLTEDLLNKPAGYSDAIQKSSGSFLLSVVYDHPPLKSIQDPIAVHLQKFVSKINHAGYPGNFLVEYFTWMKNLPSSIAKWKRDAENSYKEDAATFKTWFEAVERRIINGDERPSMIASLIEGKNKNGLNKEDASFLAASMYAAGVDTTNATMSWFIHSMVMYPETQQRAQAEIDGVIGRSRVPTLADKDSLPYIEALIKELLRLRPATPLIPRATMQDDWYMDYFIPKGTVCIMNVWGMNRDPDVYGSDADEFNPTRHLKDSGITYSVPKIMGEGHVTFGFGKRLCIGRQLALNTLFINVATILWATSISPVKDSDGNPILPSEHAVPNEMIMHPQPFKCSIVSRFPEAQALLAQARELNH